MTLLPQTRNLQSVSEEAGVYSEPQTVQTQTLSTTNMLLKLHPALVLMVSNVAQATTFMSQLETYNRVT